jgi:hypothetical protein
VTARVTRAGKKNIQEGPAKNMVNGGIMRYNNQSGDGAAYFREKEPRI